MKLFFSLFKKRLSRSFFHKKYRDIVPFHNLLASNPLSSDPRSSNPRSSDPRSSNPRSSNPLLSNLSHPINSHPIHTRPNHSHPIVSHLAHSHPTHYHIFNSHPIHTHPNHSHPAHSHPIDSHPTHILYIQSVLIQVFVSQPPNPHSENQLSSNLPIKVFMTRRREIVEMEPVLGSQSFLVPLRLRLLALEPLWLGLSA